jgi:hypothetical protein
MHWKRFCVLLKKIRKTLQHYEERDTGDHSSFADGIDPEELEEVDAYTSLMEQGEKGQ